MKPSNITKLFIRLSDGTVIKGLLNMGKYDRLSDFLNSVDAEPFLIIFGLMPKNGV